MSSSKRYGSPKKSGFFKYLYYVVFGLLSLWLIASILFKKSPIDLLNDYSTKIGATVSESMPNNADTNFLMKKDSTITALKNELAICRGEKNYHKGKVVIGSSYLNLRSKPSLNGSVLLQIPAESVVDIMFYDTETFYLEGKPGSWAKIRYAGKEGYVWGNFLVKIDENSVGEILEEDIMNRMEREIEEEQ